MSDFQYAAAHQYSEMRLGRRTSLLLFLLLLLLLLRRMLMLLLLLLLTTAALEDGLDYTKHSSALRLGSGGESARPV